MKMYLATNRIYLRYLPSQICVTIIFISHLVIENRSQVSQ